MVYEQILFTCLLFSLEIWVQVTGNALISGEYSTNSWIINGTAAVFTYWNSSYPQSEGSNECITQQLDPPYRWTNVPCSEQLPYICEVLSYSKQFLLYFLVITSAVHCVPACKAVYFYNEAMTAVKEK